MGNSTPSEWLRPRNQRPYDAILGRLSFGFYRYAARSAIRNPVRCESLCCVFHAFVGVDEPQTCDLSKVSDENLQIVEADSYWCLTKLLDDIQDHYTFAQPGLQRMVQRMEELVHRCDAELFGHIVERENVQFVQFAFRWMNCLLMRELPLDGIVRIWDTYLCEDSGFESFHVYVCAAILMTFGETLKTLEFQDLVLFLQSLPTKDWVENEIDPLLSRAFILQTYFADAPSHLSSQVAQ
ncbi:unnamed protein product [Phytophthora fragariaefolia]|uniref:Unnamed protein product n=1 Tax=Phytophthora fragariaefolia TaxID=1490495 RepID=A0A9W6X0Y4_9STRA|nr:unnamed protein product [Phytophthora fragariaefolia]